MGGAPSGVSASATAMPGPPGPAVAGEVMPLAEKMAVARPSKPPLGRAATLRETLAATRKQDRQDEATAEGPAAEGVQQGTRNTSNKRLA